MQYPIISHKIKQVENTLIRLELIKKNNFIIEDLQSGCSNIENLQLECSYVQDVINSCKEFVYNQNHELSFRFYDKFKEKISTLIIEQNLLIKELQKLGSERNYELENIFDDINFEDSDFSNVNKISNNKEQSDDFNSFVDFVMRDPDSQPLSKPQLEIIKTETLYPSEIRNIHPVYDPNLWNVPCYELFKYLFDNYYKNSKKRRLTNIWFFLKEYDPENYALIATKDEYKYFLLTSYDISITNFDKAITKFDEKEMPSLRGHHIYFESKLQ